MRFCSQTPYSGYRWQSDLEIEKYKLLSEPITEIFYGVSKELIRLDKAF